MIEGGSKRRADSPDEAAGALRIPTASVPEGRDYRRCLLERALEGEPMALQRLMQELAPTIRVRIRRALSRCARLRMNGRNHDQEIEDLAQEVVLFLFERDARVLRTWDPERGACLTTFVGMIADHQAACILRSARRRPWLDSGATVTELSNESDGRRAPDDLLGSRQLFAQLNMRLQAELSPIGREMLHRLWVEDEPVESVCAKQQMTPAAVYAWRSRIYRLAKRLRSEIEDECSLPGPHAICSRLR